MGSHLPFQGTAVNVGIDTGNHRGISVIASNVVIATRSDVYRIVFVFRVINAGEN
jgi:hypothetical protein